jgi:AraC-like DNA-binding protein
MSIMGLRQQDIYSKVEIDLTKKEALTANGVISADLRSHLTGKLTALMQHEHAYRNPELRISEVANTLGTNRTYISTVIRDNYNENFIGLVNRYRIGEAKELLSADNSLSVADISEKVGFKSISSFILFFKKETGVNPSHYRKIAK